MQTNYVTQEHHFNFRMFQTYLVLYLGNVSTYAICWSRVEGNRYLIILTYI